MKCFAVILLISLFATFNKAHAEWMPYRKTDKGPYGTYVLFDQLTNLFPSQQITTSYDEPEKKFKSAYDYQAAYVVIAPYIEWTEGDLKSLRNFLEHGNVLVVSANFMDSKAEDWLGIKFTSAFVSKGKDSVSILNSETGQNEKYDVGNAFNTSVSKFDSASATGFQVLGAYANGLSNCILFKAYGGYVLVHTQPYLFSNYHLIKKKTKGYSELFFSSFPGPLQTIYWDESAKSGANREMEPLRFVMSQPPLRSAFWWAIAGLLLLILFSLKRRQGAIPVLTPFSNNSLDMVKTVSDMYYFSRRNNVIAKKKIAHWLEFLRVKYNIVSSQSPRAFWQSFRQRSSLSNEEVEELKALVEKFRDADNAVSDSELIKLNRLIDSSYKP